MTQRILSRSAALNPPLTTNSEQFTANRSGDPAEALIKHHESEPLISEVWCEKRKSRTIY